MVMITASRCKYYIMWGSYKITHEANLFNDFCKTNIFFQCLSRGQWKSKTHFSLNKWEASSFFLMKIETNFSPRKSLPPPPKWMVAPSVHPLPFYLGDYTLKHSKYLINNSYIFLMYVTVPHFQTIWHESSQICTFWEHYNHLANRPPHLLLEW